MTIATISNVTFRGRTLGEILPRVLGDVLMINFAVALTYHVRWLTYGQTEFAGEVLWRSYLLNAPILTLVSLITFYVSGFYTQTRVYRGKYRALVIIQAVCFSFLVHFALLYFVDRTLIMPRSVGAISWALSLALILGSRLAKQHLASRYVLQSRAANNKRPVRSVLVVGGAGYIGSVLTRRLLDQGYHVRVLDAMFFGDAAIRDLVGERNFELMVGDFRDIETVVRATKYMDAVVHLGAIVGDPACSIDSEYTVDINFVATRMIREVCKGYGVSKFVFVSTCSVYGAGDHKLDENSELKPLSLYAQTKVDAERALLAAHDDEFRPTILRLGTAFGHSYRPRFDLVINLLTALAVREGKFKIFGGDQWRPFVHVKDISDAIIKVLAAPLSVVGGEIFNVGDERLNHRLLEIGEMVKRIVPDAELMVETDSPDKRDYRVNFDKIHKALGFQCNVPIDEAVEEIKAALLNGNIGDIRDDVYNNYNYMRRTAKASRPRDGQVEPGDTRPAAAPGALTYSETGG